MPKKQYSDFRNDLRIDAKGNIVVLKNEDVIKQSIKTILSTIPGERVRNPDFGSRLYEMLFEPMDDFTASDIRDEVQRSLESYEDRIILRNVSVIPDFDNNYYEILINYVIRLTGRSDSVVSTVRVLSD